METLQGLEVKGKPVITLFNKVDRLEELPVIKDFHADVTMNISAKNEQGFEELMDKLAEIINKSKVYIEKTIPYQEAGLIQKIRKFGNLIEEEYREDGIFIRAYVDKSLSI